MIRATFLGGPRDGETIDWQGWELHMPARRSASYVSDGALAFKPLRVLIYHAQQDDDGRWFYVQRPER